MFALTLASGLFPQPAFGSVVRNISNHVSLSELSCQFSCFCPGAIKDPVKLEGAVKAGLICAFEQETQRSRIRMTFFMVFKGRKGPCLSLSFA